MARLGVNDLDYLAARFHGRRGRMAEGERLEALCRLRTLSELAQAIYPESDLRSWAEFQRWAAEDLLTELSQAPAHLDEAGSKLLTWLLVRFQVENLKVLLRAFLSHTPLGVVKDHLVSLPLELELDAEALLGTERLEQFVGQFPSEMPRKALGTALERYRGQGRPFFLEAVLDQGFFQELLARTTRLSAPDREIVTPLIEQEVKMFQWMLVVRGRFGHGMTPDLLRPLHIGSCGISAERFQAMLTAADLRAAAGLAVGCVIDILPWADDFKEASIERNPAQLEALAWERFLRLANSAFRRSHMGLGAIMGYAGIRRVEVANLITLSEGIRAGLPCELIRARLVPRHAQELVYV